ncbi:RagB/SusD family nutrient uptake outer membrane protein [Sphingobacterium sp. SGG-5]|uniref:RagB/SusD family nutrient uptake outer membrane protein n=1 Tax=Sphingobacterium sp. SGG-5 TaxID=2710881 RepID=UPI0013EDEA38|nr:RagB/SusD family nutrient uptake outer membrane protein [Sphingobacterium sp. SGG-5]NGM63373.1 RagB/SusD family nutrient uptake outer membrane protein [Sphingobacterium sp. SGG-5]
MKRNILIQLSLCAVLLLTGCEKLLEINPKQSIDSSEALTNEEGIHAALISVYARLQNYTLYGRDYLALSEALSDNAIHTSNASHLTNEAMNGRNAHFDNWQVAYYAINQANLVIDAVHAGSYGEKWKATILGQAYFLRALCYHDLVRVYAYDPTALIDEYNYGGVPLMLVGVDDISKIGSLKRAPIAEVYDQIYKDLDLAHENLGAGNETVAPHRATQAAVSALYARVALYRGDYPTAVDMADRALTETKAVFSTQATYVSDWLKQVHPESIFELKFNISENVGADRSLRSTYTSRATYDATTFTIQAVIAVDPLFYDLYEPNDVRRELIRKGVGKSDTFWEMYKFISKNGTPNLDNVPILRLSEVYLNRAEALYHQGPSYYPEALEDLNKIRTRAGLSVVSLSGDALLEEILLQRRFDLAFEGHRWFDLKRNGLDVIKATGNVLFTDYRILARIPIREVDADEDLELKQNYNY